MIDVFSALIYLLITVIIGCFLLSGFFGIIISNVDYIIFNTINTINIINSDDVINISIDETCLNDVYKNKNTFTERFLFWLYLTNSGYAYVHAFSNTEKDINEYENPTNLLLLNLGGIFIFFTTINPTLCKRSNYDFVYFLLYIGSYIISLHFNILTGTKLNNIVLSKNNIVDWDWQLWMIVIFTIVYLSTLIILKFIDFALKSIYIFKFYIVLLISSFVTISIISFLYIKINGNILHIHHYFVGTNLIVYTASYYHPSDIKKMFIAPYIIHIFTIITQAILLGIIIDGVSNYGIKTIYG